MTDEPQTTNVPRNHYRGTNLTAETSRKLKTFADTKRWTVSTAMEYLIETHPEFIRYQVAPADE